MAIVSDLCLPEQDLFLLSGTYADWDDKENIMHLKTLSCTSCSFHLPTQPLSIHKILCMCPLDLAQVPAAPSVPSIGEDTLDITSQLCPQVPSWGKSDQAHGESLESGSPLLWLGRTEDAFINGNCIFRAFSIWHLLKGSR